MIEERAVDAVDEVRLALPGVPTWRALTGRVDWLDDDA